MSGVSDRPTRADIDLGVFSRNIDAIVSRLPAGARLVAVLKANAYGHGAIELARKCDADRVAMIAVALLEEAIALRQAGITLPLFVFGSVKEIDVALDHDITLGVVGPEEHARVCEVARHRDVNGYLKLVRAMGRSSIVDSGMGRMRTDESDWPQAVEMIRNTPRLKIDGIPTHLANADEPNDAYRAWQ